MALREIEEADLANLQGVGQIVQQMLNKPEARKLLLQARKAADPNAVIPEIDAAAPVNSKIDKVEATLAALNKRMDEDKAEKEQNAHIEAFQRRWNAKKDELRQQGWRADGIAAVVKFAEDNQIADLGIAAAAFEKMNPPVDPAPGGAGFGMFGGARDEKDTFVSDMMKSGGNSESRLDQQIRETLADLRGAR